MSFGFVAKDAEWNETNQGVIRTLKAVDIFEITVTAMPAYQATSVALRSLFPDGTVEVPADLAKPETRDLEDDEDGSECDCDCPECESGDCEDCSDPDCEDPNCTCMDDEERNCNLLASVLQRRLR